MDGTGDTSSAADAADLAWLELMIEGLERGRAGVPSGPTPDVQALYVGHSGAAAMHECFPFYRLTKARFGAGLERARILDFGVGWGRLIRLFAHDVPEPQLFGVDVDPDILQLCVDTGVPGTFLEVEPRGPLPFDDGAVDLAYAYSVFSHLAEDAAVSALAELARVVRPGGQLTLTTPGARFLDVCIAIRAKGEQEPLTGAEASIDSIFDDPVGARAAYDRGAHVYSGVHGEGGGGVLTDDFYGWAAVPDGWFRNHAPAFVIEDVSDDPAISDQVVFTLRRA